ncbi:flagellar basal body P-ring formation chaperone FlgA [Granulosicoccus sp. 3-233]|uniref:flagellar basal body P-ring formation chaperone FlgA n=1 Tax=Granulosicoccus sp. 3-233 TaxID=3417969 RepID=UPI003D34875C
MDIRINRLCSWHSSILCSLLLLALPGTGGAAELQSLEAISQAVREFVVAEQPSDRGIQVEVNSVDSRLRLARCEGPLQTFWSPGSRSIGRVTVQVECPGPKPWRLHVQSTVTLEGEVWVLSRGVQRGDLLDESVLVRQAVTLGANNAAFTSLGAPITDLAPWMGYSFTQRVSAGKVLNERMLKPARLVRKGEAVLIRMETAGLKLQTKGVALKDAAAGKAVQVRNSRSGKVIDAIVVGKGVVAVLN